MSKRAGEGRYPIRNDSPEESERLSLLERASDPGTISLLESLGIAAAFEALGGVGPFFVSKRILD